MSSPFSSYADFASAVLSPIDEHRREHDEHHWYDSAAAVSAHLLGVGVPSRCSTKVVVSVTGWLNPRGRHRISKRRLESINPGYTVSIRRSARKELGRIAGLLRAGFTVEAEWTGDGERAPFAFAVFSRDAAYDLPASNSDAEFGKSFVTSVTTAGLDDAAQGYIDRITTVPRAVHDQPDTWFAELIHQQPHALFDLIDHDAGTSFGEEAARLLATFPENARWSDKYALATSGLSGRFCSDLLPVAVVTPNPTPPAGPEGFVLPAPVVDGPVVHFPAGTTRIASPSEEWLSLENVVVEDGGTVRTDDSLIVYEQSAHPSSDFVSGQYMTIFGSRQHPEAALLHTRPDAGSLIPEAILIAGRNDFNWFHWMVEYLPRVLQADGVIDSAVPVLVTGRTPSTGLEALAELSSRPVIELDREFSQRIARLHVVAPPVQILDTTAIPWRDGLSLNEPVLQMYRRALGVVSEARPTRRVFLTRNSRHRGLLNEDELADIARSRGLEVVDPGALNFNDQRQLFSNSELLVGASGAVMANYLMMSPSSRIIAMTSESLFDFVLPAALAHVAGATFTYLTGAPTRSLDEAEDRNQWLIMSDYSVDAGAFRSLLDSELAILDN